MVELNPDPPEIDDYRALFLRDTPLLDVRAPIEYSEGAFPSALNEPLINDQERHAVGIAYKHSGQDAAIQLGEKLVSGERRVDRIRNWQAFVEDHPDGALYCFRGGMRSKIAQQWILDQTGISYPRVRGGYKALRRFLIDELKRATDTPAPVVVGGRTGCGKTRLLEKMTPAINLELLAWHRGSAFGRHATPQPTQIDFENRLAIELLKLRAAGHEHCLIEDESRNIGVRHVPPRLFEQMASAPVVVLEVSDRYRVDTTLQEYVQEALAEHQALHGIEPGFESWSGSLIASLERIKKRLGNERHETIHAQMQSAIGQHARTGDTSAHRLWIRSLLVDYYDAMYSYQLEKKKDRIVFCGDHEAVSAYLNDTYGIGPDAKSGAA